MLSYFTRNILLVSLSCLPSHVNAMRTSKEQLTAVCGTLLIGATGLAAYKQQKAKHQELLTRLLLHICADEKENAIAELLRSGANPNGLSTSLLKGKGLSLNRKVPLRLVCEKENTRAAKLLLNAGADARSGVWKNLEISTLLLEHGNDATNLLFAASDDGKPDLLLCALEHGAKVNYQSPAGQSALHIACDDKNPKNVSLLLQHKANPNLTDQRGRTPLHAACFLYRDTGVVNNKSVRPVGAYAIVKALFKAGATLDAVDNYGDTPLMIVLRERAGETEHGEGKKIVSFLSHHTKVNPYDKDSYGNSLLSLACNFEDDQLFRRLLKEAKPDHLNAPNTHGITILHQSCQTASPTYFKLILDAKKQYEGTFDVNVTDLKGMTPLHYACANGYVDRFDELIRLGANPHTVAHYTNEPHQFLLAHSANFCKTALHCACYGGYYEIVRRLIDAEVDTSVVNYHEQTALEIAKERIKYTHDKASYEKIIKLLEKHKENSNPEKIS